MKIPSRSLGLSIPYSRNREQKSPERLEGQQQGERENQLER